MKNQPSKSDTNPNDETLAMFFGMLIAGLFHCPIADSLEMDCIVEADNVEEFNFEGDEFC